MCEDNQKIESVSHKPAKMYTRCCFWRLDGISHQVSPLCITMHASKNEVDSEVCCKYSDEGNDTVQMEIERLAEPS